MDLHGVGERMNGYGLAPVDGQMHACMAWMDGRTYIVVWMDGLVGGWMEGCMQA